MSVASDFRAGQRWTSISEPELGLGEVRAVDARTVTIFFPAARETRRYVVTNAPLRRAAFRPGDTVRITGNKDFVVDEVVDDSGLLSYKSGGRRIREQELHATLSFSSPMQRLFVGAFDAPAVFDLRLQAVRHQHQRRKSPVRGFLGGRIDLLPHQLSIAAEVTNRLLPRVLLADEVGLGKTIEACLIIHRLIATGRASRVLVLVQESLIHQWFLELLRRFNLWFNIFNEARCVAIEEGSRGANPFLEQQFILSDMTLFTEYPERLQQALEAGWDLVVVDEAHHLEWSPEHESPAYAAVNALGTESDGLLLLTATPEQLGMTGHFARLRLLDPHRFHDLDAFERETAEYHLVAEKAAPLLVAAEQGDEAARADLDAWLDRHGTGRVIFRNTRTTVKGFPQRLPHLYPLAATSEGKSKLSALSREWAADLDPSAGTRLSLTADPRIAWLLSFLRSSAPDKVLLICRTEKKALAIENAIKEHAQVKMAAFHEGLTLIQRDRAAAWFAEPDGARLLICSEIGSEGRNFQFAHHLVLFDLPLDPAVLEQRIGRLDRIGQKHDIDVHVPYIEGSHLEVLARWYHEGLNAFAENLQGARELLERFEDPLLELLSLPKKASAVMPKFLDAVRVARAEVTERLERGRDRLLEWQSFKPRVAQSVIAEIQRLDADRSLDDFLLAVLDHFVIDVEELSPRTYRVGSAGVLVDDFPGLSSDRTTVTADRQKALTREDLQFLTWDHPLMSGALDMLLGSDHGNCAFGRWKDKTQELYLESVYILECIAPAKLHADRFLPPTPIRIVIDRHGQNAATAMPVKPTSEWLEKGDGGRSLVANESIRERLLPRLRERAAALATQAREAFVAEALSAMRRSLERETTRLTELQRVNASVRDAEIQALVDQQRLLEEHLSAARLRLDAIRVIHRG